MINRVLDFICIWIFSLANVVGQSSLVPNPLDGKYFGSPVDYEYKLAGNFCELRETHFHAGIDIKPSGRVKNDAIYSIADGYVSRIKIAAGGYGIAVYIDHPEVGYTSVYAHLDALSDHLKFVVEQVQKAQESYEVDFLPSPTVLSVKKGEEIGKMGNTGYSFGQHLHFEVRDTKTEKPINPFHFGFKCKDEVGPTLLSLSIHGLDPDYYKIWERRIYLNQTLEHNISFSDPIDVPAWRAGIALEMYDKTSNTHNKQGIYSLHMYVDDSIAFSYHMDKISFDQAKYITGFYDNKVKKSERETYSLCYKFPGNDLEFLQKSGNGIIPVYLAQNRKVRIEVEDFYHNKRTLEFYLKRSENMVEQVSKDSTLISVKTDEDKVITKRNLSLRFDKNSLFRNIYLSLKADTATHSETKYRIHDLYEPIKSPIEISIKPENTSANMDKAIIVGTNERNTRKTNYGGTWKDGNLTTKMIEFGTYYLDYDTIAPSIRVINFSPNAGKKTHFRFYVKENLNTRGQNVSDVKIKVFIDGLFVISPYSSKTDVLEIPLSHLINGSHYLKIEASDHSGNFAYFESGFTIRS